MKIFCAVSPALRWRGIDLISTRWRGAVCCRSSFGCQRANSLGPRLDGELLRRTDLDGSLRPRHNGDRPQPGNRERFRDHGGRPLFVFRDRWPLAFSVTSKQRHRSLNNRLTKGMCGQIRISP